MPLKSKLEIFAPPFTANYLKKKMNEKMITPTPAKGNYMRLLIIVKIYYNNIFSRCFRREIMRNEWLGLIHTVDAFIISFIESLFEPNLNCSKFPNNLLLSIDICNMNLNIIKTVDLFSKLFCKVELDFIAPCLCVKVSITTYC